MGYYTYYSMVARNIKNKEQYDQIIAEMIKMELYTDTNHSGVFNYGEFFEYDHEAIFNAYEESKWYDHTYAMVKLSKLFPEVTFKLHGEGEEKEDLWDEYFHNGAAEECRAKIIYPTPVEIEWDR